MMDEPETYDDWLMGQIIKYGVNREHGWLSSKYSPQAIALEHWTISTTGHNIWVYTQKALDYLNEKKYNGSPTNENRSGGDE